MANGRLGNRKFLDGFKTVYNPAIDMTLKTVELGGTVKSLPLTLLQVLELRAASDFHFSATAEV